MNGNMGTCTKMSGTPITSISSKMLIACTARVEFIRASLYHTVSASSWERHASCLHHKDTKNTKDPPRSCPYEASCLCGEIFVVAAGRLYVYPCAKTYGGVFESSSCFVTSRGNKVTDSSRRDFWLRKRWNFVRASCCSARLPSALWTCES